MSIKLTPRAAQELKTLMKQEVDAQRLSSKAVLRLMVAGGGCSGFTYRMGFDENVTPQDAVDEVDGVRVAVDDKSALYLEGTEVDYLDGVMGRGFVFNNPNATHTCGCHKAQG